MQTIEQYLQGLFGYKFTSDNLSSVLNKRGIEAGCDQEEVSIRLKELAQADLFMVIVNSIGQAGESVSKGTWSKSMSSMRISYGDRKSFLEAANRIYANYGEPIVSNSGMKDGTNLW